MAAAVAEARAALESSPPEGAPAEGPPAGSEDASSLQDKEPQPNGKREKQLYSEEAALQRALDLRKLGRESELGPRALGLLRQNDELVAQRAVEAYKATQSEEKQFREMFLSLETQRVEEPEKFAEMLLAQPDYARFYRAYQAAHPDVSIDTPEGGPRPVDEGKVRAEVADLYGKGFEATLDAVAEDAGLPEEDYRKLKETYRFGSHPDSGNLAVFLAKMITSTAMALAKPMAEKERAKIAADERAAYDKQLTAVRAEFAKPPRQLPGGVIPANVSRADPSRALSMADAVTEAKRVLVETSR